MKTSKSQYVNVLKIDEMIRNKIYPSVKKITRELELSERQVLRLIKDLKTNYNAPIEYDREKKGYCYLLDGFSVRNPQFISRIKAFLKSLFMLCQ